MKKTRITLSLFLSLALVAVYLVSCKKTEMKDPQASQGDPGLPDVPYDYASKHRVDNNYATLGRVLFYDQRLSINNSTSCGSCHKQEFAFANNVRFDRGFNGLNLTRNSPSIQGFRGFSPLTNKPTKDNQQRVLLFWDGRQRSLSDMVLNPVTNHNEMNIPSFEELITKLSATAYYPSLFKKAFGSEEITKERIALALQSFLACLNTSVNNESGIAALNENISNGTTPPSNLVEMGQFLFHSKYNCAECHDQGAKNNIFLPNPDTIVNPGPYGNPTEPNASPTSKGAMFNIGLDFIYQDKGLGQLTGLAGDHGLFKVPTLQNISVTAPYMHDGRFATLSEVLDHYSHDIKPNQNLSPVFRNPDNSPKKLNILPAEKMAIIAFLNTLKNEDFLTSPMYSDPFKK